MKSEIESEIRIVEICQQFHWTYEEYLNAPLWFIETVKIRNAAEARFNEKELKKARAKSRFIK